MSRETQKRVMGWNWSQDPYSRGKSNSLQQRIGDRGLWDTTGKLLMVMMIPGQVCMEGQGQLLIQGNKMSGS